MFKNNNFSYLSPTPRDKYYITESGEPKKLNETKLLSLCQSKKGLPNKIKRALLLINPNRNNCSDFFYERILQINEKDCIELSFLVFIK